MTLCSFLWRRAITWLQIIIFQLSCAINNVHRSPCKYLKHWEPEVPEASLFFCKLNMNHSQWKALGSPFLFAITHWRMMSAPSALRFFNSETEELMEQSDVLTGTVCEDDDLCWRMCLNQHKSEEIQYYEVLPPAIWSSVYFEILSRAHSVVKHWVNFRWIDKIR